jgi:hypothetical protein
LKTEVWVKALIRRCGIQAVPAMVVRRGDDSAGVVMVKVNTLNGEACVYTPARQGDGSRIWIEGGGPGFKPETEVDAYIARQLNFDPDIWVIEIEDSEGRHFLDEPIEASNLGIK